MQYCIHSGVLPLSQRCPSSTCRIKVWLYLAWSSFSLTICTPFPFISDHLPLSSRINQFRGGKKPGQFPGSLSPLTSPYSPKVGRGNPTESVPQPAVRTGPALYATFSSLTYKEDPGFSLKFLGLRKLVHINWNKDYSSEIRRTEHTGEIEMHESCIFKTAFLKIPSQ